MQFLKINNTQKSLRSDRFSNELPERNKGLLKGWSIIFPVLKNAHDYYFSKYTKFTQRRADEFDNF